MKAFSTKHTGPKPNCLSVRKLCYDLIDGVAKCIAESEKQESWYAFTLVCDYLAHDRDRGEHRSHSLSRN